MISYNKIKAFIQKKKPSPVYSRRKFIFLALQLVVYAIGMDVFGQKIASIDIAYSLNQLTKDQAYNFAYAYYCGINGLFMGLGFFRLLELYWWAKDSLLTLHSE
jgi:hypothetical protein